MRVAYEPVCLDTWAGFTLWSFAASAVCCGVTRNVELGFPNRLFSMLPVLWTLPSLGCLSKALLCFSSFQGI